jgi:hypothetical protein
MGPILTRQFLSVEDLETDPSDSRTPMRSCAIGSRRARRLLISLPVSAVVDIRRLIAGGILDSDVTSTACAHHWHLNKSAAGQNSSQGITD